ncbi:aspartate kinase [Spirochaeta africana]|uniref:Aspartokinase n=1 Tax=Spirochaeta africana (strain ATCC 700263 / DSM 8902 / Z-7692) TaxID=889378 RepID=H9UMP5_SPIAZ|nr:aspartate kinase [Spirochaeta africana]AFG38788.1 aspartokinase [Spirochaeta africana DSM 8902]
MSKSHKIIVSKFGGSSVQDSQTIQNTVRIVAGRAEGSSRGPVVVLSAMRGITDLLLQAATTAEQGNNEAEKLLVDIQNRHQATVAELMPQASPERDELQREMEELFFQLKEILHGVSLLHECTKRTRDYIVSFGERLNCLQVSAYMRSQGLAAEMVDAREMIRTSEEHDGATVLFQETYARITKRLQEIDGIAVVPGFIGSTADGVTTTLGRNGSDYTASLLGAALEAEAIEIWTDVDGVLSADPRVVDHATLLPQVSFREAMELSYFGADVIHPYTMIPAMEAGIPIWIKNTRNPDNAGTKISDVPSDASQVITGLASIGGVALINIEGGGMVGIPGFAGRVFKALAEHNINIIMITQASSEHSICIVIREDQVATALSALNKELARELATHQIQDFDVIDDLEIVAVIGENMRGTPGISGQLFSTLGDKGINVLAIAQGSSEMNVSFVIHRGEREVVLRSLHDRFFLKKD